MRPQQDRPGLRTGDQEQDSVRARREMHRRKLEPVMRLEVQALIQVRYSKTLSDGEIEAAAERCLGPATLARIFVELKPPAS